MNINSALQAGREGFMLTVGSILDTLLLGFLMGYFLKVDKKISYLISTGTAIYGNSAIAAVSPVIKANEKQMSVALGIIFTLNSKTLLIFPALRHCLHLTDKQFGVWCAVAIHDTSSVVRPLIQGSFAMDRHLTCSFMGSEDALVKVLFV